MLNEQRERRDKRVMLAGLALLGMCVGGTALAELLEDAPDEKTEESQRQHARTIAESAVMLGDSILEIIEPIVETELPKKDGAAL